MDDELEEIFGITGDDATDFAIIEENEKSDKKEPDSKGTGCLGVMLLFFTCVCVFVWFI